MLLSVERAQEKRKKTASGMVRGPRRRTYKWCLSKRTVEGPAVRNTPKTN